MCREETSTIPAERDKALLNEGLPIGVVGNALLNHRLDGRNVIHQAHLVPPRRQLHFAENVVKVRVGDERSRSRRLDVRAPSDKQTDLAVGALTGIPGLWDLQG